MERRFYQQASIQSGMAHAESGRKAAQSLIELRSLAARVLAHVSTSKDSLEESVNRVLTAASGKTFQDFDRAWIYEITSGVLRYRGRLDFIIDTYSLKKKPTGEIRRFLQIGVYQLLAQDVPPPLAVSETVQAIRQHDGEAPSKFANALLRKVADSRESWINWKVTEASPFEEQVAWCSLPEWLFKRLRKERGSAWVFSFSESVLDRPQVWYRTPSETMLLNEGYRGNEPPGFVQDISNQKLVDAVVEFLRERKKEHPRILDLCSAPGGKSLGLAFSGFSVIATDVDEERLQKVRENVSRLSLKEKIEICQYPAIHESDAKFDVIWIDAPCSSTGIIRRHPEIKWNRTLHDVERMVLAQEDLMTWAGRHLESGGVVIYSTCSLLDSENSTKVEGFEVLKRLEWAPQNAPRGDGIRAVFYLHKNC
jgi:16S rRNA (cytosine967-C5)-methyltransferase